MPVTSTRSASTRFPTEDRSATDIWPIGDRQAGLARVNRLAREHPFYQRVLRTAAMRPLGVGWRSVAVPLVGAVAASLAWAEVLWMLHGGIRYESIDVRVDRTRTERDSQETCCAVACSSY
jgi:hypothetical protein